MHTKGKGVLVLDPRTKIILLLGVNIFVFTNHIIYAELAVIMGIVVLMLLSGIRKTALKTFVTYYILLGIQLFILPISPKFIINTLTIVVITCRKLLPCVSLGALLVQTTPIRLLIHALEKWHCPQSVIIPLAITVRYFPTLHEEYQSMSDAMKLRNVKGIIKKLEYIFIPLIMSASATADELSQAITARGIDNPRPKTCSMEIKFHWVDWVMCAISAVLILLAVIVD